MKFRNPCLTVAIITFTLYNVSRAEEAGSAYQLTSSYSALAGDLAQMDKFFKGGKTGKNKRSFTPVSFDSEGAKRAGFATESIKLAEAMAGFSNDIYYGQREAATNRPKDFAAKPFATVNTFNYPNLEQFFSMAANAETTTAVDDASPLDAAPKAAGVKDILCSLSAQCTCGWYANPRPSRAAERKYFNANNPEATLRDWGYHPPLALEGEGWTRARTYKWYRCGFSTFRDNAAPVSRTRLWEQNYKGWEPNGEPNPEVYRSGPWPYADWPAYVFWWHQTH